MRIVWFMFLVPVILGATLSSESICSSKEGRQCKLVQPSTRQARQTNTQDIRSDIKKSQTDEILPSSRRQSYEKTWRVNKKAIAPIMVGIAIKFLIFLGSALSGLSLMGIGAILTSKLSLAITSLMFIRRFFGSSHSSGGFFGLNPLGFPHAPLAFQDRYKGTGHRKSFYIRHKR